MQILTKLKNKYVTGTEAARQCRQFLCIMWNVHPPLDSLTGNTCGSYDEIQMSPVIIVPICVFLWELSFDICDSSIIISQGILCLLAGIAKISVCGLHLYAKCFVCLNCKKKNTLRKPLHSEKSESEWCFC